MLNFFIETLVDKTRIVDKYEWKKKKKKIIKKHKMGNIDLKF